MLVRPLLSMSVNLQLEPKRVETIVEELFKKEFEVIHNGWFWLSKATKFFPPLVNYSHPKETFLSYKKPHSFTFYSK